MGYARTTLRPITLALKGAAGDEVRCWDAPAGQELKLISIYVSSGGVVLPAADLDWEVFWGGGWTGEPYASASTHKGGISKASGAITGSAEVAHNIYNYANPFPRSNDKTTRRVLTGTDPAEGGFPIVLMLTNQKAVAITVYVSFVSETISDVV